jgi:hypothetical protein
MAPPSDLGRSHGEIVTRAILQRPIFISAEESSAQAAMPIEAIQHVSFILNTKASKAARLAPAGVLNCNPANSSWLMLFESRTCYTSCIRAVKRSELHRLLFDMFAPCSLDRQ